MKAEGSVKHEHIVEAAIKRFSHFGINKTTLGEIAEDTGISKPSLFYYFQDKSSLLEAVARKITGEFLEQLEAGLSAAVTVDEGLQHLLLIKRDFFKKYLLLAIQAESVEMAKMSADLPESILAAQRKSEWLISELLKRGIAEKTIREVDTVKTSQLLLETLRAFEHCIKSRSMMLEGKDIDSLFDKEREVLEMFLNGLKSSEWKN